MKNRITYLLSAILAILIVSFGLLSRRAHAEKSMENSPSSATASQSIKSDTQSMEAPQVTKSTRVEPIDQSPTKYIHEHRPERPSFLDTDKQAKYKAQKREIELKKLIKLLNLTPEQVAEIKEIYQQIDEAQPTKVQTISYGEDTPQTVEIVTYSNRPEISQAFSEEQKQLYQQYQAKQNRMREESNNLRVFASIQEEVEMTEEQKDQVFTIINEGNYKKTSPQNSAQLSQNERLLEELGSVLSGEQLEGYKAKLQHSFKIKIDSKFEGKLSH